jgi:hypothetical protein
MELSDAVREGCGTIRIRHTREVISHPGQGSFDLGKMVGKKFTFLQAFSNVSKDLVLF